MQQDKTSKEVKAENALESATTTSRNIDSKELKDSGLLKIEVDNLDKQLSQSCDEIEDIETPVTILRVKQKPLAIDLMAETLYWDRNAQQNTLKTFDDHSNELHITATKKSATPVNKSPHKIQLQQTRQQSQATLQHRTFEDVAHAAVDDSSFISNRWLKKREKNTRSGLLFHPSNFNKHVLKL